MTVFYLNPSGNIVSSLEGFPILRVLTRLANLLILRNKRKKKKKNNRKRELCPKYELEVTYECRKLGSSGRLFEGQVIFSKVRRIISTLLYIRVKRVVVFPPTPPNSKKSGVLGGYCERVRGLKKEYCQIDPTKGEGGPNFSSALTQHNDYNPRY